MAVTARFLADFSGFVSAVNKAEVELKDFEGDANKVQSALQKMTDRFTGTKVVQEALLMEKAIQQVGGVTALTTKELEKAGRTASEAIEIMKKGGQTVPPGLLKIAEASKTAQGGLTNLLGTAGKIAGAVGIGFGVGAVVSFGKAIIADADALQRMHDVTGISVSGLQRLRAVGADASVSLDQMTGAITQMQRRLAGGDQGLIGAFNTLGLKVSAIEQMQPDKQFMAIGDAIRGIKDPAEQVNAAMEIFGRSGADLLPVIKKGFDEVTASGVVMSDEAVEALDNVGDEIELLWARTKKAIAESVGQAIAMRGTFQQGMDQQARARALGVAGEADALAEYRREVGKMVTQIKEIPVGGVPKKLMPDKDAAAAIRAMDLELERLNDLREASRKAGEAADKAFDTMLGRMDVLQLEIPKVTGTVRDLHLVLGRSGIGAGVTEVADGFERMGKVIPIDRVRQLGMDFKALGPALAPVAVHIRNIEDSLRSLFKGDFGQVFKDIGKFFKDGAKSIGIGFLEGIGANLLQKGVQLVEAGFKKLFHFFNSTEQKKVNDMRDQFVAMSGGLATLNERAQRAGFTLDRMLKAESVKAYTAEVERLQAALDFQSDALDELADAEEKYHLSLDKTSADLFKSYKLLTAGGRDAGLVLSRMKDDWIALVKEARTFGITLPAELRPILERLGEMTDLTDEEREILGDINDLKFSDVKNSFTSAFDKMTEAVDKLVAAIKASLGLELTNIERQLLGIEQRIGAITVPGAPEAGPGSPGEPGGGIDRNPGGGYEPRVPEAFTSGMAPIVVHTHHYMDGHEVAEIVTTHQTKDYQMQHQVRVA